MEGSERLNVMIYFLYGQYAQKIVTFRSVEYLFMCSI